MFYNFPLKCIFPVIQPLQGYFYQFYDDKTKWVVLQFGWKIQTILDFYLSCFSINALTVKKSD